MSEPSQVHGRKDQIVGATKETVGSWIGNEKMKAEVRSHLVLPKGTCAKFARSS